MAVDTSLNYVRISARRYARKPDENSLTTAQLDQKINYFGLYILPLEVPLMPLRKVLTFYTTPNVDTYKTIDDPAFENDPLFNFKNRYVNVHQPVFFAGIEGMYYQDRSQFYADWPQINSVADTTFSGNGVQQTFNGVAVSAPMLQNSISFTTTDTNGNAIILVDYPQNPNIGFLGPVNDPQNTNVFGQINYITGVYTVIFATLPGNGAHIYLDNINYQPAKPFSLLFYDNEFTIRPVPDKSYTIQINVDALPTELLDSTQSPDINNWVDVYALGAARLLCRDELDTETLAQLDPLYQKALDLVRRPTLRNSANMRTPSFYNRRTGQVGWFNNTQWPM